MNNLFLRSHILMGDRDYDLWLLYRYISGMMRMLT